MSGRNAQVTAKIDALDDWRGETAARMRDLIHEAVPDVEETVKWRGTPVFEKDGILTTLESYKDKVKLTFAKGAQIEDPNGIFNASLDGNARRAIDLHEGDSVNASWFKALVKRAAEANAK